MFSMAGDLNSSVFTSEKYNGDEKDNMIFAVRICLFNHFLRGHKLEYNYPHDILVNSFSGKTLGL